ncbi:MAG TPA: alpha/beta hydrolase [Burkholderiales bacterium]|nr:alpha/beta hydrolase [Burkholderiales bacterium]
MRFCVVVPLLFCLTTEAQEIVTVATRPGVTQSFFVAGMGERKAEAVALLYVGGGGIIRLRMEGGQPKFGANNFLPRSRGEFIRDGVLPVVMDAPSDQPGGLTDYYRSSGQQAADARGVLAELKKRFPQLPVFLVGTSRGTISAAFLGRALGNEVAGVVLTSTLFVSPRGASLAGFDYASIKAPLLFVHHREDGCEQTPYTEAHRLAARYPLVSVKGGKPPESGPCDPFAPHGFWGKEPQTVDAIAGWMLNKPYPREID